MSTNELRENYRTAMQAYLEEVQMTHQKAIERDAGFVEQLKKEREAEKRYREAQIAFTNSAAF